MESRNHKQQSTSCPSPLPSSSSSLLKDISNYRTPKNVSKTPNFPFSPYPESNPKFFTVQKAATPVSSSSRRKTSVTTAKLKVARRLKAFELEQSKSARRNEISKEKSLKSLAKSLSVWLNFLFENPKSCGCDVSTFTGEFDPIGGDSGVAEKKEGLTKGKRETGPGNGVKVGIDGPWRGPKRQKDLTWREGSGNGERVSGCPDLTFSALQGSLREVCSFNDLKERMRAYLSLESCNEIFDMMTQVAKNIDEGRLKIRANCPIVTDFGMKERSMGILMSYNPVWLRIGLHIILGGDSLLPNAEVNSEEEMAFLRMVIEKQFLSHAELAKTFAYNKMVDGLYRPGYFEKLGNVILKRFLLLVLVLDRAKSHSSLPTKYGIDGLDGGSPLLFSLKSNIKSSRHLITDFLSTDVMHGEGNLLAHLMIVGYKVTYQQSSLIEYSFRVKDLFEDLQDGIRLCRAIQLLQHDSSILLKLVVPSDTHKKSLSNCGIALQYLKQAGVPLCDEDGMLITDADIVNREKELVLSLLWNMFVHLQLPLLINKKLLAVEISKIRGVVTEHSNTCSTLDMLLNWIQAIGDSYDLTVENFSSLVDGRAMWCLLDYYFRKQHHSALSSKDLGRTNETVSLVSANEYTDAVHNFILSQKLTSLLGNFPEVLQVSDILEHNGACNDRSVVILLVFLSFQLLVKRNKDQLNFHKLLGFYCQTPERKCSSTKYWFLHSPAVSNAKENLFSHGEDASRNFKAIMAWWQEMAQRNNKCNLKTATISPLWYLTSRRDSIIRRENAAKIIQSHFRRSVQFRRYMKIKKAACLLQTAIRAWLSIKSRLPIKQFGELNRHKSFLSTRMSSNNCDMYMTFMVDRHSFVQLKRSIVVIQHAIRAWISRSRAQNMLCHNLSNAAIVIQKCFRGWKARSVYFCKRSSIQDEALTHFQEKELCNLHTHAAFTIQKAWRNFIVGNSLRKQHLAAIKIQSCFRRLMMRKHFLEQNSAVLKVQSIFRCLRCSRELQHYRKKCRAATTIQSHVQGWIARRRAYMLRSHALIIQSHFRGWLTRKELLFEKEAAIKIQNAFRCTKQQKAYFCTRVAAVDIQRFVRGHVTRKRILGASFCRKVSNNGIRNFELKIITLSVLKLQRWWKDVLFKKLRTESAIIIQSYYRAWIARQRLARDRQRIVVIQSYWKGYLARKASRGQLLDLRLRVQKSAANIDDSMRLINRLVAALSELLSKRSISGILHTCATLDMATEHSQRCCEELVAAGAIGTLLKLIGSVSRSIPDQEVLKHALSTLRNLARYPHLTEVLIENDGCVKTILWEFIRNKEEGYFIASDLLKKICVTRKGVEAVDKQPALLKRLHSLVEDLAKKAGNEKRSNRDLVSREQIDRRLREAVELIALIRNGKTFCQ
ncbi:abnormal spindle-like microcephaly-associated protein homolog isoform X1 [Coffea eugenioides]|uniref:abnormal spindle-like microcephaly-associated protein homolog isoform X1 n=1 Tax=Coffea eugenioides TaxID=49369 RepID=UPI000F612B43|nr:abnormal spindle-like microcephaly-associated protein homolog isoform X1 [Coffea eugenioides]